MEIGMAIGFMFVSYGLGVLTMIGAEYLDNRKIKNKNEKFNKNVVDIFINYKFKLK